MRTQILALAGLAVVGASSMSGGALADTFTVPTGSPTISHPSLTTTEYTYSLADFFHATVETLATYSVSLGSADKFFKFALSYDNGSSTSSLIGKGGGTFTKSADLQAGSSYSYVLNVYVPNGTASPVQQATITTVAAPGPAAGAGPAGLALSLVFGGLVFGRKRSARKGLGV